MNFNAHQLFFALFFFFTVQVICPLKLSWCVQMTKPTFILQELSEWTLTKCKKDENATLCFSGFIRVAHNFKVSGFPFEWIVWLIVVDVQEEEKLLGQMCAGVSGPQQIYLVWLSLPGHSSSLQRGLSKTYSIYLFGTLAACGENKISFPHSSDNWSFLLTLTLNILEKVTCWIHPSTRPFICY